MSTFGFYSWQQQKDVGTFVYKNSNGEKVSVTQVNHSATEEDALDYFNNVFKVNRPDGVWMGQVTTFVARYRPEKESMMTIRSRDDYHTEQI